MGILVSGAALIFLLRAWRAKNRTEQVIAAVAVLLWVLFLIWRLGLFALPARLAGAVT